MSSACFETKMTSRDRTAVSLFADQFVMDGGSVPFRYSADKARLEMCILHHTIKNEWRLPKGRKDRGESIEDAAMRESFEETGYPCKLFPVDQRTRATIPGVDSKEASKFEEKSKEPIAVTIRQRTEKGKMIIIWWYVSTVDDGVVRQSGTQTATESFESAFFEAEVAIEKLTFAEEASVARKALELIKATRAKK